MSSTHLPSTADTILLSAPDAAQDDEPVAIGVDVISAPVSVPPDLHADEAFSSEDSFGGAIENECSLEDSAHGSPTQNVDSLAVSFASLLEPSPPSVHPSPAIPLSPTPDTPASSFKRLVENLSTIQQLFASAEASGARAFPKDAAKRMGTAPPAPPNPLPLYFSSPSSRPHSTCNRSRFPSFSNHKPHTP
jgi:hypothetical protein